MIIRLAATQKTRQRGERVLNVAFRESGGQEPETLAARVLWAVADLDEEIG
jgi:hypothetical protein